MSEKEKMNQDGTEEKAKETKPAKAERPRPSPTRTKSPAFSKRVGAVLPGAEGGTEKGRLAHPADTLKKTGIVIVCVIVVGIIVWIFDGIASSVIDALLSLFGQH